MAGTIEVKAPDGSEWFMTIASVARHKAEVVAKEKGEKSLEVIVRQVFPEFVKDPKKALDWAKTHMLPEDVQLFLRKPPQPMEKSVVLKTGTWVSE